MECPARAANGQADAMAALPLRQGIRFWGINSEFEVRVQPYTS